VFVPVAQDFQRVRFALRVRGVDAFSLTRADAV